MKYSIDDDKDISFLNDEETLRPKKAVNPEKSREDRLSKARKKPSPIKNVLLLLLYMTVVIAVIALGTALYVWVDEKIKKSATETAMNAGLNDTLNVTQVYSDEQVEEMLKNASVDNEAALSEAEAKGEQRVLDKIKSSLLAGNSYVETLRPLYPGQILLVSDGAFHFVPVDENIKSNDYLQEKLIIDEESGEFTYVDDDGNTISHKGIDVSSHQGSGIDWEAVAEDDVEFVFIRAGYRGYGTEGKLMEDANFRENIEGALDAGLHVGVYFYSQATNEDEAREEAELVIDALEDYDIDCPIVIDVEKAAKDARIMSISAEERTENIKTFADALKEEGYDVLIYHNMEMGVLLLDLSELEEYDKWFAGYTDKLYYPYEYKIWQYTDSGSVDGIKGNVDLNISFSAFWE
ncbi:MAG: glycoside hydrolase family 25 protein [Lachnospiraceae bacterium]|nr:glycoside hydrolase family 25 protein [Lachnospiraceae bacterium]